MRAYAELFWTPTLGYLGDLVLLVHEHECRAHLNRFALFNPTFSENDDLVPFLKQAGRSQQAEKKFTRAAMEPHGIRVKNLASTV